MLKNANEMSGNKETVVYQNVSKTQETTYPEAKETPPTFSSHQQPNIQTNNQAQPPLSDIPKNSQKDQAKEKKKEEVPNMNEIAHTGH